MGLNVGLFNDSFPPTIDGVANCVKNYADIITDSYGTATVVTPEYPHVIDNKPYEVYRYSSVKFSGSMPYRVGNPFSPVTVMDLKRKNFDILHVHCPFASAVLAHEVSGNKIPTVFTYHTKFDIDIDNFVPNKQLNSISRKFILNNINLADEVWCVSQGAVESLRTIGYTGEVTVMRNGTDFKKGKAPATDINEIKRKYRLEPGVPIFLFCGRTMWYKNLQLIIDGLKKLKESGFKFKTLIVGDGPDRPSVEEYAKNCGFDEEYLVFTGAVYDRRVTRAFFSCADLLLFPSTYDTSGLVVKEAAACECAAILVKGSCAAEGVTHGFDGLLIDENADSFASTLAAALNEKGYLNKIGMQAAQTVYYSWEQAVDTAYKRYFEVIEKFKKNIIP